MKISHLDHFVLTVKDLDVSSDFYRDVLGMEKDYFFWRKDCIEIRESEN